MECKFCGKAIPRGMALKLERGTPCASLKFCSEDCYQQYLATADLPYKMTDMFCDLWDDADYPTIMKHAQMLKEEYGLTYKDIGYIVKYAIVYENVIPTKETNLYWFIPKYMNACAEFREQLRKAKETEIPEPEIIYIKGGVKKPYFRNKQNLEWTEEDENDL